MLSSFLTKTQSEDADRYIDPDFRLIEPLVMGTGGGCVPLFSLPRRSSRSSRHILSWNPAPQVLQGRHSVVLMKAAPRLPLQCSADISNGVPFVLIPVVCLGGPANRRRLLGQWRMLKAGGDDGSRGTSEGAKTWIPPMLCS